MLLFSLQMLLHLVRMIFIPSLLLLVATQEAVPNTRYLGTALCAALISLAVRSAITDRTNN